MALQGLFMSIRVKTYIDLFDRSYLILMNPERDKSFSMYDEYHREQAFIDFVKRVEDEIR